MQTSGAESMKLFELVRGKFGGVHWSLEVNGPFISHKKNMIV